MNKIQYILLSVILLFSALTLSSCQETVAFQHRNRFGGPPAHAPAHGVRNKKTNTVVVVEVEK